MFFKNFKKIITLCFLSLFIIPYSVCAYSDKVIVGGQNIGITLNSDGILVVGVYDIEGNSPGREAGLKSGDRIALINNQRVNTIEEMADKISISAEKVKITFWRNNKEQTTSLKLYKDESGVYKTGLYVKDSITGIGTLTFIDPETRIFGALGHEIQEQSTGKALEIKNGKIFNSTVTGVIPSSDGNPGEKKAKYDAEKVIGDVFDNTTEGIFGKYTGNLPENFIYEVADASIVHEGKAKILTVLDDTTVNQYEINIIKVNRGEQKTRNFVFEITDEKLLKKTNGIVQGMSGSPIIQDDKIIGAVTHVVVDDPHKGYGIFITNMLKEAGK